MTTGLDKVENVWVLASGPSEGLDRVVARLPQPDKIVAADGGSRLAARLGLKVDLVVGDLDSSDPAQVKSMEEQGTEVRRYRHEIKWETDTELAVLAALDWKPSSITILGALGGRLDHTLANILMLTHPSLLGVAVHIVTPSEQLFIVPPRKWAPIPGEPGDTVSVLPIGDSVTGVRNRGLLYPLEGEELLPGRGRGISNEISTAPAEIWVEAGKLLVIVLHRQEG